MTKFICFSDYHLHKYDTFASPDKDNEYPNDRFRYQIETLQKVYDLAREHNASVLGMGDYIHKRASPDVEVINHLYRVIARNHDIPSYLLIGNHDLKNNHYESEHSMETFKSLPHVEILDRYKEIELDDTVLCPIPYSDDVEGIINQVEDYSTIDSPKKKILMAHLGIDKALVGKGSHRMESAFSIESMKPEQFYFVLLGHYHKRQHLTDNMFYIGNTIQTSFSDEGQEKGVFLIDTETEESTFIPIENKQFVTVRTIEELQEETKKGNYIRAILPAEEATKLESYRSNDSSEESNHVRIEKVQDYQTESRINIDLSSNEEDIIRAYCKEKEIDFTDKALEVFREAISR